MPEPLGESLYVTPSEIRSTMGTQMPKLLQKQLEVIPSLLSTSGQGLQSLSLNSRETTWGLNRNEHNWKQGEEPDGFSQLYSQHLSSQVHFWCSSVRGLDRWRPHTNWRCDDVHCLSWPDTWWPQVSPPFVAAETSFDAYFVARITGPHTRKIDIGHWDGWTSPFIRNQRNRTRSPQGVFNVDTLWNLGLSKSL